MMGIEALPGSVGDTTDPMFTDMGEITGDGSGVALPLMLGDCSRTEPGAAEFMVCGYECECGFKVSGAREYEMEWIAQEHRALIHGDGEG